MKILIIDLPEHIKYPTLSYELNEYYKIQGNYTMEDDFNNFLIENNHLITNNKEDADWFYLPVNWCKLKSKPHDYPIELIIKDIISNYDFYKIFTIISGSISQIEQIYGFENILTFNSGYDGYHNNYVDIPLLSPELSNETTDKKYLISFIGSLDTNREYRKNMYNHYKNDERFLIKKTITIHNKEYNFERLIQESYLSLCPKGYYSHTYRFFQSLQLGTVPLLFSNTDNRPFKDYINWDEISFFAKNYEEIEKILKTPKTTLIEMGEKGKTIYYDKLNHNKWCSLVIKILEEKLR